MCAGFQILMPCILTEDSVRKRTGLELTTQIIGTLREPGTLFSTFISGGEFYFDKKKSSKIIVRCEGALLLLT